MRITRDIKIRGVNKSKQKLKYSVPQWCTPTLTYLSLCQATKKRYNESNILSKTS